MEEKCSVINASTESVKEDVDQIAERMTVNEDEVYMRLWHTDIH